MNEIDQPPESLGPHSRSLASRASDLLWAWMARERLVSLVAIAVLVVAASASVATSGRWLIGPGHREVFVALQLGLLSCVGLWMALVARSWTARLGVPIVVIGTGLFMIAPLMGHGGAAELRTIMVGHVVTVALVSRVASKFGLVRVPAMKGAASGTRQFNLRQIFAWTTTVAILAYLTRRADPPHSSELVYFVVGPLLALGIACVMMNAKKIAVPAVTLHLVIVIGLLLPDRSISRHIEILLVFYLVQAVVVVGWLCVWREFEPRSFNRKEHSTCDGV